MMNENWEEVIWRALRNECSAEELEQERLFVFDG